jgi:hypothetical protein
MVKHLQSCCADRRTFVIARDMINSKTGLALRVIKIIFESSCEFIWWKMNSSNPPCLFEAKIC